MKFYSFVNNNLLIHYIFDDKNAIIRLRIRVSPFKVELLFSTIISDKNIKDNLCLRLHTLCSVEELKMMTELL